MNHEMTAEDIALERERIKQRDSEMQSRLAILNRAKVERSIEELTEAAKKREDEAKAEEAVLAEIVHRRALRKLEDEKEAQRVIDENKKINERHRLEEAAQAEIRIKLEDDKARLEQSQKALFEMEQQERRLIAELAKPKAEHAVEVKPVTLHDAQHPLSMIFGAKDAVKVIPEISYEETYRTQTAEHAALRHVGVEEVGKLVDHIICYAGVRTNQTELVNMLSRFPYTVVEESFNQVLVQHKKQRMSGTDIAASMQMLLAGQDAPVQVDTDTVACPVCHARVPRSLAMHDGHVSNPRSAQSAGLLSAKECEELLEQRGQK